MFQGLANYILQAPRQLLEATHRHRLQAQAEGKQRCTATMARESQRMCAAPYHSCVAFLFLLLFLLLQTRLEWPQDLGAVTRHPQRYAHRLRRTTRVGTGPRCRMCCACKQRRLTSTKKVRFSNNEGWVFNLPSLVSSKSPLHLLRMSMDEKEETSAV